MRDEAEAERPVLRIHFDGVCKRNPGGPGAWAWSAEEDGREVATNSGRLPKAEHTTQIVAIYGALISALRWVTERGLSPGVRRRRTGLYAELMSSSDVVVRQAKGEFKVNEEALADLHAKVKALLAQVTMPVRFSHEKGGMHPRVAEICGLVMTQAAREEEEVEAKAREQFAFDAGPGKA